MAFYVDGGNTSSASGPFCEQISLRKSGGTHLKICPSFIDNGAGRQNFASQLDATTKVSGSDLLHNPLVESWS